MEVNETLVKRLEKMPYWELLGIKVESIEEEKVELKLPFRGELTHSENIMHGGVIGSLVDAAGAVIFLSKIDLEKENVSTIELKVNYLNPVLKQNSRYILARSRIIKRGKNVSVSYIEVKDDRDIDIAVAIGTYTITGRK